MLLVMDIGNTRAKWCAVNEDGTLGKVQACVTVDLANSTLKSAFDGVTRMLIANVAGDELAAVVKSMLPPSIDATFLTSHKQAGGLNNTYKPHDSLGIDRWMAAIAVWNMKKQPSVVVSAGTAVTVDAVTKVAGSQEGEFVGGTIMPGLQLMQAALETDTAKLKGKQNGCLAQFPSNTQDAVATGCLNAVVGGIVLVMKQLEQHSAYLPTLILAGGDANKVAEALKFHSKRVIIAENLVLQGLAILEKEL